MSENTEELDILELMDLVEEAGCVCGAGTRKGLDNWEYCKIHALMERLLKAVIRNA